MNITYVKNKNLWSILFFLTLFLYIIGVIVAWLSPAEGFEANIYATTPILFWIAIILLYIVGSLLVIFYLKNILCERKFLYMGYFNLVLAAIGLMSTMRMRGYHASDITGDTGTHISYISQILSTGYVSGIYNNPYPLGHIQIAVSELITILDIHSILFLVPLVGSILYVIGVILLSKRIFPKSDVVHYVAIICLILPAGCTPLIGNILLPAFSPMRYAIWLMPLMLFAIQSLLSKKNSGYFILSAGLIISINLIHPMMIFYSSAFLGSLMIVLILSSKLNNNPHNCYHELKFVLLLTVLSLAIFMLFHFDYRSGSLANVLLSLIEMNIGQNEYGLTALSDVTSATSYGYTILDYLRVGFINIVIFITIPIMAVQYLFGKCYRLSSCNGLAILLVYAISLGGLTIGLSVVDSQVNLSRFIPAIFICALICSGYLVWRLFNPSSKQKHSDTSKSLCFICLVGLVILSVVMFYPSPYNTGPDLQNTNHEEEAMKTLLPILNPEYNQLGIYFTGTGRYMDYLYGENHWLSLEYDKDGVYLPSSKSYCDVMPHHFGYDNASTFNLQTIANTYFFNVQKDYDYYNIVRPMMKPYRWTDTDWLHIKYDSAVNLLYNNGQFNTYLI